MKPIPRHWATLREQVTAADGAVYDLTLQGSSDLSPEDALRDARERLDRLMAAGGPGRRERSGYEYYPSRRLPEELLEEIHAPDGTLIAAVTRNRYGAAVLNTDALLISDIDLGETRGRDDGRRPHRGGLLSRLFGGAGPSGAGEDPELRGDAGPGRRGEQHAQIVGQIEGFSARHPELGVRTYRTRNGFRLLVTGSGAGPTSERAQQLMHEVRSDRLYMLLCRVHDSYRARLTPKPWRIGVDSFTGLGTRVASDPVHTQWVERYRAASQDVAVCRLLGVTGPAPTPTEQHVIDLHDRATRPESGLILA